MTAKAIPFCCLFIGPITHQLLWPIGVQVLQDWVKGRQPHSCQCHSLSAQKRQGWKKSCKSSHCDHTDSKHNSDCEPKEPTPTPSKNKQTKKTPHLFPSKLAVTTSHFFLTEVCLQNNKIDGKKAHTADMFYSLKLLFLPHRNLSSIQQNRRKESPYSRYILLTKTVIPSSQKSVFNTIKYKEWRYRADMFYSLNCHFFLTKCVFKTTKYKEGKHTQICSTY